MDTEKTRTLINRAILEAKYNNDAAFLRQVESMAERYIYFSENRDAQGDKLNDEL